MPVALVVAILATPAVEASAAPSGAGCAAIRSTLSSEQKLVLGKKATYKRILSIDEYQLDVATRFGDSDRVTKLSSEIDYYTPSYALASKQLKQMSADVNSLQGCGKEAVVVVQRRVTIRALQRSLLVYTSDLAAQKRTARDEQEALDQAGDYGDSVRESIASSALDAAKAAIRDDKTCIARIEASIRALS